MLPLGFLVNSSDSKRPKGAPSFFPQNPGPQSFPISLNSLGVSHALFPTSHKQTITEFCELNGRPGLHHFFPCCYSSQSQALAEASQLFCSSACPPTSLMLEEAGQAVSLLPRLPPDATYISKFVRCLSSCPRGGLCFVHGCDSVLQGKLTVTSG